MARGAWEELGAWEILLPVEGSGGVSMGKREGGGVRGETQIWKIDVGIEEVGWAVGKKVKDGGSAISGMAEVLGKWCREI